MILPPLMAIRSDAAIGVGDGAHWVIIMLGVVGGVAGSVNAVAAILDTYESDGGGSASVVLVEAF